jgi:hypothetical protein
MTTSSLHDVRVSFGARVALTSNTPQKVDWAIEYYVKVMDRRALQQILYLSDRNAIRHVSADQAEYKAYSSAPVATKRRLSKNNSTKTITQLEREYRAVVTTWERRTCDPCLIGSRLPGLRELQKSWYSDREQDSSDGMRFLVCQRCGKAYITVSE